MWADKDNSRTKKSEKLKKEQLMNDYINILLKKCEDHSVQMSWLKILQRKK